MLQGVTPNQNKWPFSTDSVLTTPTKKLDWGKHLETFSKVMKHLETAENKHRNAAEELRESADGADEENSEEIEA